MEKEIVQKLNLIADYYGMDSQLRKTVEEQNELTDAMLAWEKAVFEGKRDSMEWENILEETADVLVMICQIIHLTGQQPEMVEKRMIDKIDRQIYRIEEEKENDKRGKSQKDC